MTNETHAQDTPDTAAIRERYSGPEYIRVANSRKTVLALCDALDAATARAEAADADAEALLAKWLSVRVQRDRARGTAAALEAEVAVLEEAIQRIAGAEVPS